MLLQNQYALVTGAGQSIGREIALVMARHGCNVAVNDLVSERAEEVVREILAMGRDSVNVSGDISAAAEVDGMIGTAIARFGKLDILVNNAGIILTDPFREVTEAQWDKVMAVNLKGPFLSCRAVTPHMLEQKSGRIINLSSIAGKRGGGLLGNTVYAASKAGVIGLTKGLARELGPFGIRVNAICPGYIETEMTKSIQGERREALLASIPLRKPGKPGNIADAVVFLASSLSDFIAGEIMDVDGGFMTD